MVTTTKVALRCDECGSALPWDPITHIQGAACNTPECEGTLQPTIIFIPGAPDAEDLGLITDWDRRFLELAAHVST